jgi:hypothetical protein
MSNLQRRGSRSHPRLFEEYGLRGGKARGAADDTPRAQNPRPEGRIAALARKRCANLDSSVIVMAEVLKDEHGGALDPLPTVAEKINALFDKAAKADAKAETYRISAGQELANARTRVEAGEVGAITWTAWCAQNIRRSEGDIRKVLAIANAADPDKAAAAARLRNREAVAKHRAYVSAVGAKKDIADVAEATPVTIDTVKRDIQLLSADERSVLADWLIEIVTADKGGAEPATAPAKMVPEEAAGPPLVDDGRAPSVAVDPPPQFTPPSPIPEAAAPPERMADEGEEEAELASVEGIEHQEPHSADPPNPTPPQPRPSTPAHEAFEPPMPAANPIMDGAAASADRPSGMPQQAAVEMAIRTPADALESL